MGNDFDLKDVEYESVHGYTFIDSRSEHFILNCILVAGDDCSYKLFAGTV